MKPFQLNADNKLDAAPPLSSGGCSIRRLQEQNITFFHLTTGPLSTSPQSVWKKASAPSRQWHVWIVFTYGFLSARRSFNLHLWMSRWAAFSVISRDVPEPIEWFPSQNRTCFECSSADAALDHRSGLVSRTDGFLRILISDLLIILCAMDN